MIRLAEAALFLGLAGVLHVAALTLPGLSPGGSGGGDGGANSVTLQAAPETLAALAQSWERPPATSEAPELTAPQAPLTETDRPKTEAEGPKRSLHARQPQAPSVPDKAPDAPQIDNRLPVANDMPPGQIALPPQPQMPKAHALPQAPTSLADPRPSAAPLLAPPSAQIDTVDIETTPTARYAPRQSLRPQERQKRQAERREPPQTAQPAQRASGSGAAPASRTQSVPSPAPGPSEATLRSAQASWGAQVRQSVARAQRYPRGTTARGIVTLRITLSPAGQLAAVQVTGSSGEASLDQAAIQAARAARLPRAPKVLTEARYSFNLPLQFARR